MNPLCVIVAISTLGAEVAAPRPVESLGVQGRHVAINGEPAFLVGQMSYDFAEGRTLDEVREIVDAMMVPYGMNLVVGDCGVINWGAWNNLVNVRRGLERSIRHQNYAWQRTGTGTTTFGGPRFDLDKFNEPYFERLAAELRIFNERGIVPVVGIFSEHALNHPLHWRGHPFHPENNVNEIGLPERDALPEYFQNAKALAYQEAYVRKLLDAIDGTHYLLAPFGEVNAAPPEYVERWLALFQEHERTTQRELLVCLSGRSEVLDRFAPHPAVDLIDVYCYHDGKYDGAENNVPNGEHGILRTLAEAWEKYHKPVGKLYFKYGYPYADRNSPWADPTTGTQGGGPPTAARDALAAVEESGGFGIYFKMAWARDRGDYMRPDLWSQHIREFRERRNHVPKE